MSKKWVALLLVVCIGLAGGVGFMRMNADVAAVEETPTPTPEVDEAAAEK